MKSYGAEFIGTFWLVLGGCGSAVIAAAFPEVGIGLLGVSLAFGLTVLTMAYAIGHISGCHLNPAVTVGLAAGGRFPASNVGPYIVAQVARRDRRGRGALRDRERQARVRRRRRLRLERLRRALAGRLLARARRLVTEIVMTLMFLVVILGRDRQARAARASRRSPIGLGLTLIHLISIPVTNTSVNPARTTGVAVFVGGWAISQLWLFWVAPIAGAVLGATIHRAIGGDD